MPLKAKYTKEIIKDNSAHRDSSFHPCAGLDITLLKCLASATFQPCDRECVAAAVFAKPREKVDPSTKNLVIQMKFGRDKPLRYCTKPDMYPTTRPVINLLIFEQELHEIV